MEKHFDQHEIFLFCVYRVQNLKETIERLHGIPASNQVLLISGGEVLNILSRVCSYQSGTDENPIYMFSTLFNGPKLFSALASESRKYLLISYCIFDSKKKKTFFEQKILLQK